MKSSLRQTAAPHRQSRPCGNNRPQPNTPSSGQHPRRRFLGLAAGAAALPAISRIARAQAYPMRPVRIVVPFAAGGGTDLAARLVGQWLSERLGQPFIIENRPGGGTNIGTEIVVRAVPDGHTLLVVGTTNTVNATLYDKLSFNFVRDIAPVAGILRSPYVMVTNLSVRTIPEFIAYAKANPGRVNMASAGTGTGSHMDIELFKMTAGIDVVHVPYRGSAPAMSDLLGGQVQVMFDGLLTSLEHIRAGKLRALGVTTVARSIALPDLPAIGEFLPGFEASLWYGLGAPRRTPPEVIYKLNKEVNAALADLKFQERLAEQGGIAMMGSPTDFSRLIADETEKWANVVKFAGIKAD